ncbi:MAG: peptidoglycan-binding domain-containing protein, partial [Chitinophagales bacterium]
TGRVNGEMTAETLRALEAFQKDNGIKIGDRSAKTLNAIGVRLMDFDIDVLQETLAQKGFEVGSIDGILGPKTRVAYQTFLRKNNLSGLGFSEEIKEVLMKKEETVVHPAIEKQGTPTNANSSFVPESNKNPKLPSLTVQQVQEALFRKGYNPGDKNGILSPQTEDALFKYQMDKLLPIGGFNEDTMKSLGL